MQNQVPTYLPKRFSILLRNLELEKQLGSSLRQIPRIITFESLLLVTLLNN